MTPLPTVLPSDRTLSRAAERALHFLNGVATSPGIRAELARVGYGEAEHREGMALLAATLDWRGAVPLAARSAEIREARAEVARWRSQVLPRLEQALARKAPAAAARIGAGLDALREPLVVATLWLDRVARDPDPAGRALLDSRRFGAEERAALRETIELARSLPPAEDALAAAPRELRRSELTALARWHSEWAAAARSVLRRRDQLIALGLARRANGAGSETDAPSDESNEAAS